MDIYLTDLSTNDKLRFPMIPEKIQFGIANQFYNFSIINIGAVRIPSGQELDTVYWDGMFPGKARQNDPYIKQWGDPRNLYRWIEDRKAKKGKNKKLRLLITETPINIDVYLESFDGVFGGGYGDFNYKINLVQAKDIKIYASGTSVTSGAGSSTAATVQNSPQGVERTSPPPKNTHTIVSGDTLWRIAQVYMGAGSKYPQIYEANIETIESEAKRRGLKGSDNGHWIFPGTILTIPG